MCNKIKRFYYYCYYLSMYIFSKINLVQHHQLALGLSAEWSLLGDGWIPLLFWFSEPSLHDGALSPRSVPGGSWERDPSQASAALSLVLWPPSLPLGGFEHLNTTTSDQSVGQKCWQQALLCVCACGCACADFSYLSHKVVFNLEMDS